MTTTTNQNAFNNSVTHTVTTTTKQILHSNPILRALYLKGQIHRACDLLPRVARNCPNLRSEQVRQRVVKNYRSAREARMVPKVAQKVMQKVTQKVTPNARRKSILMPVVDITVGSDPLLDLNAAIAGCRHAGLRSFLATVLNASDVQNLLVDALQPGRSMPARIVFRAAHACRTVADAGYLEREVLYVATYLQGLGILFGQQQNKRTSSDLGQNHEHNSDPLQGFTAPSDWVLAVAHSALRQLDADEGVDAWGEPLPSAEGQLLRLCMGWIDGPEAQGDEVAYLQKLPLHALRQQGLVAAPKRLN